MRPPVDAAGHAIAPEPEYASVYARADIRQHMRQIVLGWGNRIDHGFYPYEWGGGHFCHHYDEWGHHWLGIYNGPVIVWAVYVEDGNMFAWPDPFLRRVCYLSDGQWWYRNPVGMTFVYSPYGYCQYRSVGSVIVVTPEPGLPPTGFVREIYSPKDSLSIHIDSAGNAYLYDSASPEPQMRGLDTQVADATFTYGWTYYRPWGEPPAWPRPTWKVARINLRHWDGEWRIFDRFGNWIWGARFNADHPAAALRVLRQKMGASAAFRSLKSLGN